MTARTYGETRCTVCGVAFTREHWNNRRCPGHRSASYSPMGREPGPLAPERVEAARELQEQTGRTVVAARYPGTCPLCTAGYAPGELVSPGGPEGRRWGHADCMDMAALMSAAEREIAGAA